MGEKVKVFIKIRNDLENNIWEAKDNLLKQKITNEKEIIHNCFLGVYNKNTSKEIFEDCLKDSLINLIDLKKSSTIFAYGQTGTGKTYFMMGDEETEYEGIIKIYLKNIFKYQKEKEYKIRISYLEIYNENLNDLLNNNNQPKFFSSQYELKIDGLDNLLVESYENSIKLLKEAELKRRIEKTDYNLRSSRSHTILKLELEKDNLIETVSLIDLAGSEKCSLDFNRRIEGSYINKSLLALGSLIKNINTSNHLNYRDSKLTRVLEPSLRKEVDLFAFCMINPTLESKSETINTLGFASRLSEIKMNYKPSKINNNKIKDCLCEENKLNEELIKKLNKELNKEIEIIKIDFEFLKKKHEDLITTFLNETSQNNLLKKRIKNLENIIYKVTETFPTSKIKDIFLIEKGLFNLKMEDLNKEKEKGGCSLDL